ncbi:uncharacterized protein LOC128998947 [Macrosteles quadrilineatus]|uniref:uncharacterized protein LOC128998947 n=1 Tax=Macrosteles quadrilineatus TaxID=74068 RepID=UPI0023E0BF73|nr:uncharacterized protein LOC128998947 [Macrosteles quadrilineatus]
MTNLVGSGFGLSSGQKAELIDLNCAVNLEAVTEQTSRLQFQFINHTSETHVLLEEVERVPTAMRPETLVKLALLTSILTLVTASTGITLDQSPSSVDEGRGGKEEKMIQEMIQAMMLAKNMVSFALMFVSPIIQIKGFGLSVVNTLINIGRFLVQLQATHQMKQMHTAHLKVHYNNAHQTHDSDDLWSSGSSNHYAYYAPPPRHDNAAAAVASSHTGYNPPSQQHNNHYSYHSSQIR